LFHRSLRAYRRVVDLFKSVGSHLSSDYRHDFDMPVIVVIDRLPVAESFRGMQTVMRSVQPAFGLRHKLSTGAHCAFPHTKKT
jgi:hypothetical protein